MAYMAAHPMAAHPMAPHHNALWLLTILMPLLLQTFSAFKDYFWLFRTLQRSGKAIAFVKIFFSSASSSCRRNPIGKAQGLFVKHFCH